MAWDFIPQERDKFGETYQIALGIGPMGRVPDQARRPQRNKHPKVNAYMVYVHFPRCGDVLWDRKHEYSHPKIWECRTRSRSLIPMPLTSVGPRAAGKQMGTYHPIFIEINIRLSAAGAKRRFYFERGVLRGYEYVFV